MKAWLNVATEDVRLRGSFFFFTKSHGNYVHSIGFCIEYRPSFGCQYLAILPSMAQIIRARFRLLRSCILLCLLSFPRPSNSCKCFSAKELVPIYRKWEEGKGKRKIAIGIPAPKTELIFFLIWPTSPLVALRASSLRYELLRNVPSSHQPRSQQHCSRPSHCVLDSSIYRSRCCWKAQPQAVR